MRLSKHTWREVVGGRIVCSVGSFEQHGPHLPLYTDTLIAETVAEAVAERLGATMGLTVGVGVSPEHMGFPGTLTLTPKTFKSLVGELIKSLRRHGFDEIILINGHGGNNGVLKTMRGVKVVNLTELIKPYDHAGEVETSLIMHIRGDLVRRDKIRKQKFSWPGKKQWKDTREFSESGVLGDPTLASPKKGKEYLSRLIEAALKEL